VSLIIGINLKVNKMEKVDCSKCTNKNKGCVDCRHNKNLNDYFKQKDNLDKLFTGATVMLDTKYHDDTPYGTITTPILVTQDKSLYASKTVRLPSEEEIIKHKLFNVWLVPGIDRPIFVGYDLLIRGKTFCCLDEDIDDDDWNRATAFMVLKDFDK